MKKLKLLSYLAYATAIALAVVGLASGDYLIAAMLIAAGINAAIAGVLFEALDLGLTYLADMREALASSRSDNIPDDTSETQGDETREPTKSLSDLSNEIEKMKKKL